MTIQSTAGVLFQTATARRYTWDENFPGYSADVQLIQGNQAFTGQIRVNRDLSVEVTGVANKQIEEGIEVQLQEIVTRRQPSDLLKLHSQHEFTLSETDADGKVTVFVKGDSLDAQYQIRDQQIYQERRVMGRIAVTIDTLQTFDTGAGYIASRYDVTFSNSKTDEVTSLLKFTDSYEKFGDYYILTKQVVEEYENSSGDIADSMTEFSYSNIKLLEPAIV
ncbi:MAG TPA: DUF3386 domain-containing protein [Nostocaceae cyanobacterium]|nr:DUF3386 domain-containing protein [Nostocaceae cyanobacterium]